MNIRIAIARNGLSVLFDTPALRERLGARRTERRRRGCLGDGMTMDRSVIGPEQSCNAFHDFIISHEDAILFEIRGCRIVANMPAFQASDESSILSTRTKEIMLNTSSEVFCFRL